MSKTPLLSVFIPTYNGENFVREAVESVLDNGFTDLEVVVVDDGSADGTAQIVGSIRHPALRFVRQATNLGVVLTRRRSISLLRGRYMALLDQDDIAMPGRFERQINRLEAAGGPDILGGGVQLFGEQQGEWFFPSTDAQIRAGLLFFDCPLANPTICMKLAPFREGRISYSAGIRVVADYALWVDAMHAELRFENLPILLTRYRRHSRSMTRNSRDRLIAEACVVRRRVVETFFPTLTTDERAALVDALSYNLTGSLWINGIYALSHAAMLTMNVPRADFDSAWMIKSLEKRLVGMIKRALELGMTDNETLEMMTESNEHFAQWRAADNGALDVRIMALFT